MTAYKLAQYIELFHEGNASEFGRAAGVTRQQVQKWLKQEYIVVEGVLYSPRRNVTQEVNADGQ